MNYFLICLSEDNDRLRKLYFRTGETNVIQTMMEIYSCFIAGLSIKEIQAIIEERDKKFANNRQTKRKATKFDRDSVYDAYGKTNTEYDKNKSFGFPILPNDDE